MTSPPYTLEKKLCSSKRIGKLANTALKGRLAPFAPRGGAPACARGDQESKVVYVRLRQDIIGDDIKNQIANIH